MHRVRQAPGPLTLEWLETGDPPVEAPSNSGYGRGVITEHVSYERGTARLLFSPEGIRCRLNIPAIWLAPGATEQENGAVGRKENNASGSHARGMMPGFRLAY